MEDSARPEQWLPVPVLGYEGLYEVSDLGRVRRVDRTIATRNQWGACLRFIRGRVLKPRLNMRQEFAVSLSGGGERRDCRIHRLVLEAFDGPCPPGMEALHGPAGRLDDSRSNLRWGTKAENQADRLRDGTSNHGERNSQCRLTDAAVMEVRRRCMAGETQNALATAFGVGRMTVSDIVRGKSWRHLPGTFGRNEAAMTERQDDGASALRARGKYGRRRDDPSRPALHLSAFLTGVIPAHPSSVDYLARLSSWQMLGNDVKGDCVAVTWANLRRLVTAFLATEKYPGQAAVDRIYATQNAPGEDNGMDIQTLLGWLTKNAGPDGAKLLGFAKVDHANPEEVKAAIAIGLPLWTGFSVQQANETQFDKGQPWDYAPGSPVVGGHSVLTGGYGTGSGVLGGDEKFITWAQETSFTDKFWAWGVEEVWATIWPEHLGSKEFLAGLDLAAFAAAYTAITGKPFPADMPPVPVPPAPAPPPDADPTDLALFTDPRVARWVRERHVGDNRHAAAAVLRAGQAKGLMA